nr:MAG TPA: hypothetical protein [Caudoviricetes sp.]
MDRKQVKEFLPILQAFTEGKDIESHVNGKWYRVIEICNDINPQDYRIKPEPKFRPFANAEECWAEMQKHQPFGWVKSTLFKDLALVQRVTTLYVEINRDIIDYKDTLEKFNFADGAHFGIKVEE